MEEQKQQMDQEFEEAVLKVEELEGKVEAADLLIENLHNQLQEHEDYRAALAEQDIRQKIATDFGATES